ncbi:hypothetical protein CEUSTIGMA_g12687.t1 [Chlamydomonas eustigma]|uniref:Uncharacterized protein n=1 Tax=Chlamydomonas eustigma TaxID=1157962 RepID=A0A250XQD4_9CHLO|nr:hypothetical protein CEUSTIGMA_g12687.t1 [Chlamydomonas eustigma]|eukprot:GAX85268.1 hypothetical protein CEUSTIGMA_g12687.t1 [Chlamydomonas eustigma]
MPSSNLVQLQTTYNKGLNLSSGSNASVLVDGQGSNVQIQAAQTISQVAEAITGTAGSDVTFVAGTGNEFLLNGVNNSVTIAAASVLDQTAGAAISTSAGSNVTISAGGSNSLIMDAPSQTVHLIAESTLDQTAGTTVNTTAGSTVTLSAGYNSLILDVPTATATLGSGTSTLVLCAASNTLVAGSNVSLIMNAPSQALMLYAESNIVSSACNAFIVNAPEIVFNGSTLFSTSAGTASLTGSNAYLQVNNSNLDFYALNNILIMNSNNFTIDNASTMSVNTSNLSIASSTNVQVQGSNVFTVTGSNVQINGELVVNGDITSINTYQENLQVFDKNITLSAGASNGVFMDGTLNTGSGLVVAGFPSLTGSNLLEDAVLYEKSFKFNCPTSQSMTYLLNGSNIDSVTSFAEESYWELKGGDFRMTLMKSDSNYTSFGFRIGAYGELELLKKYQHSNLWYTKVVSKFGRVLDSSGNIIA